MKRMWSTVLWSAMVGLVGASTLLSAPPDDEAKQGQNTIVKGRIVEIQPDGQQFTLRAVGGRTMTFQIDDKSRIQVEDRAVKVSDLKVASRTSSFAFKGHHGDVQEIAEKLKVATVLEGSVRKAGNRVRITGQLIGAADGYHLWSETYDRQLEDIFAIQDDIAQSIVTALKATLAVDEGEKLVTATTERVSRYTQNVSANHRNELVTPLTSVLTRRRRNTRGASACGAGGAWGSVVIGGGDDRGRPGSSAGGALSAGPSRRRTPCCPCRARATP